MGNMHRKLRGKIVERYGSQNAFAKVLGTSVQTLSYKMTGKTSFSLNDVKNISSLLGIPKGEVYDYFFAENVQGVEHTKH